MKERTIIHLDIDAFYPAVETLDNPDLRGQPVIVGGSRERGVVSSASYEARRFGIRSAQPMALAMRLCPMGVFLPVRMARYKEFSRKVFEIFYRITPLVEPISIDEAFLDVTDSTRLFGPPEKIAKRVKETVLEETGLTVSAGVAPSKFVSKIASDFGKPDGLTVVAPGQVKDFLDPLPIKKMWGVGEATKQRLARLNIKTFKDLSQSPLQLLEKNFGNKGREMYLLSSGIDEREVITRHVSKSIGHEHTFSEDIVNLDTAKKELLSMADEVARRMRRQDATGRTVTLKVKYNDFTEKTHSITLNKYTHYAPEIYSSICQLLSKTEVGSRPVRLLGISISRLGFYDPQKQLSLFCQESGFKKRKELNTALDSIYERFGEKGLRPGILLER